MRPVAAKKLSHDEGDETPADGSFKITVRSLMVEAPFFILILVVVIKPFVRATGVSHAACNDDTSFDEFWFHS